MSEFSDKFKQGYGFLKHKKLFLLDLDGTLYEENRVFEATLPFLKAIKDNGARYVFITNNSSKSVEDYIQKLDRMGISADYDEFFTSSQATALYIKKHLQGQLVFTMGTRSLIAELEKEGIPVTEEVDENAKVVLLGYDTELTYEKLRRTSEMLTKYDVSYIATNADWACPTSFGFAPDCAAMAEMLWHATGKKPYFIGKPEPTMVNFVMEKFNASKEETVIIGDRLYTDIRTGNNSGITSVCVLSGEAKLDDITNGDIKPTLTLDGIGDILNVLTER